MRRRAGLRWAVVAGTLLLLLGVIFAAGYYSSADFGETETESGRFVVMKEKMRWNGADYVRKQGLGSYLLLVVNDDAADTPQVGTFYLAVTDSRAAVFRILQIDRDCLTTVPLRSDGGGITDEQNLPLCMAYPLGGGGAPGCENTVLAVSGLLGGVPIDGYAAIPRSRVSELRADIDRVTEQLTQRTRDSGVFIDFIRKAEPYITTDMAESRMLMIANDSFRYSNGGFLTLAGEDGLCGGYDVFLPEERGLKETVVQLFYDMEGEDRNGK